MTSFNLLRIGPRRRKNIPLSPPFAVVRPRLCGPHQILPKIGATSHDNQHPRGHLTVQYSRTHTLPLSTISASYRSRMTMLVAGGLLSLGERSLLADRRTSPAKFFRDFSTRPSPPPWGASQGAGPPVPHRLFPSFDFCSCSPTPSVSGWRLPALPLFAAIPRRSMLRPVLVQAGLAGL